MCVSKMNCDLLIRMFVCMFMCRKVGKMTCDVIVFVHMLVCHKVSMMKCGVLIRMFVRLFVCFKVSKIKCDIQASLVFACLTDYFNLFEDVLIYLGFRNILQLFIQHRRTPMSVGVK